MRASAYAGVFFWGGHHCHVTTQIKDMTNTNETGKLEDSTRGDNGKGQETSS